MSTLEQFVASLGPHAKNYTEAELKQLHVEVRQLAEVLLSIHRAKQLKKVDDQLVTTDRPASIAEDSKS